MREDTNLQTCYKKVKNTFVLTHEIEEGLFFPFSRRLTWRIPDPHLLTIQTLLKEINGPPPKNKTKRKKEEERRMENGNDKFLLNQV